MNSEEMEHGITKTLDRFLISRIIGDYLEKVGHKKIFGTFCPTFFMDSQSGGVTLNRVECIVEDPCNPQKTKVEISNKEATAIIAKAKHINLETSVIKIERF